VARVALATCAAFPVADEDQPLLVSALAELGIDAVPAVWDQGESAIDEAELVIVRSTWDYTERLGAFLDWVASLPAVANPMEAIRWSSDKRYLDDLGAQGIPVISTSYPSGAEDLVLPDAERVVVKPSVGAGSIGAERFEVADRGAILRHVDLLSARGRQAMVQPYLEAVDVAGETAVISIDDRPAHAVAKAALLDRRELDRSGLFLTESITARAASASELAVAAAALEVAHLITGVRAPFLYSRVDLLPGPDGPVVVELELIEPSLFLTHAPSTARLLAAAVAARLGD